MAKRVTSLLELSAFLLGRPGVPFFLGVCLCRLLSNISFYIIRIVLFKKNECEGFNMVSKHEKTDESTRPQTEGVYCFRVLMMTSVDFFHDETWCMSFLKQLLNRISGIQENTNIHELFTCCRQACCHEKLYYCGDLSFQKGCDDKIKV